MRIAMDPRLAWGYTVPGKPGLQNELLSKKKKKGDGGGVEKEKVKGQRDKVVLCDIP